MQHHGAHLVLPLPQRAFICLQFITCCLLSMGHAAETVGIAANCFAVTLHIHRTGEVPSDAAINWHLRLVGAFGMVVGILLGGWRLVPVSGMLLPCSSSCCSQQRLSLHVLCVSCYENSLYDK